MPKYISHDYRCDKCDEQFVLTVEFDERDKVQCPQCGEILKRLISAPNFGRHSVVRNGEAKGILRDLLEVNSLETDLARGKITGKEDTARVESEIKKLKFD